MKQQQKTDHGGTLVEAAVRLIAHAESMPLGTLPTDVITKGRASIEAADEPARRQLFEPTISPASSALLLDFKLAIEHSGGPTFGTIASVLTVLHDQTLDTYGELADLIRGPRGQRLVRQQALTLALGEPNSDTRALAEWMKNISAQIAKRPDHSLHSQARVISELVPSLATRLDAVERRHREHAAAEAAAEAERQRQAEQARAAAERAEQERLWAENLRTEERANRDRRENLSEHFKQYETYVFNVSGKFLSGKACVADLLAGAPIAPYYNAQNSGERPARELQRSR